MRATDGTIRLPTFARDHAHLADRIVLWSTCGAIACAVFLLARRVSGSFASPLLAPYLIAIVTLTFAWAYILRELTARSPVYLSIALGVLALLAIACSYPGARIIDWLAWPTAMFAVVLCPPIVARETNKQPQKARVERLKISTPSANEQELDLESGNEPTDLILQQLTRIRTPDGQLSIFGTLTAEFTAGQRQITLFAAFCPPFETLPEVEANIADATDATVKVSQLLHNGIQLEVRLPEPAEHDIALTIEFQAAEPLKP